ncbi:MAG: amidohydrolase family protein [Candidatus Kapaibacterium sp.]
MSACFPRSPAMDRNRRSSFASVRARGVLWALASGALLAAVGYPAPQAEGAAEADANRGYDAMVRGVPGVVRYYTLDEGRQVLQAGLDHGLKLKVHCDELADVGAASLAAEMGAVSADHLLFVSDRGIDDMKRAGTVATLLPGTAYFIRMPFADARKMIDRGAIVALSTDCNPGSSFTENMQLILSFSVINMGMTAEEAITAATLHGAHAINQSHRMGSLEPGKMANFIVCDVPSYTDLFYHFGINHVAETWIEGVRFED